MAASHEEAAVANGGDAVFFFAATIDRHAFANQIVVADDDLCFAAAVADILGITTQHSARKNAIAAAERHLTHDRDVGDELRAAANADERTDDAMRPYFHV